MLVTTEEKIRCLQREVNLRQRLYPSRVANHRMTQKAAYREIETMKQILDDYETLLAKQDLFAEGG